jgi:GAF domain-containing protein
LAQAIAPILVPADPAGGSIPCRQRNRPDEEPERLLALRRMRLVPGAAEPALDRIADLARTLLGTPYAAVTVVDEDRQTYRSQVGRVLPEVDRAASLCDHTIRKDDALIVPDARRDRRFAKSPLVTDDPGIRFYAGFPIESPDGYRIGALCVYDTAPRAALRSDAVALRDLAKLVQRELANEAARLAARPAGEYN